MKQFNETYKQMQSVTMEDIVKAGGACIGNPETCQRVLQYMCDSGVDEALLLMQCWTTPHEAIMRSIEMIANEVRPKLRPRAEAV
jgi:hypothetical protein